MYFREIQYINPNDHKGILAPMGRSIPSAATYESGIPVICENVFPSPPTSMVNFPSILKSPESLPYSTIWLAES